ncbi:MAG: ATP-binding protein [Bryobacteraceae bacterium]
MSTVVSFQYRRISDDFIAQLCHDVRSKQSAVLIGPRYCGKRYVLARLASLIEEQEHSVQTVLEVQLLSDSIAPGEACLPQSLVRALAAQTGDSVILAANVDALDRQIAGDFLKAVWQGAMEGRLTAVLTSESDLRELGQQPVPDCPAVHYVVQGFERAAFAASVPRYARTGPFPFDVDDAACNRLWEFTGGNVYLLRVLLLAIADAHKWSGRPATVPDSIDELAELIRTSPVLGAACSQALRNAVRLISLEPSCWEDLEKLVRGDPVALRQPDGPPDPLTLSGIAVREDGQLQLSSKLTAYLVRRHYSELHVADLYARKGWWEEAFRRYAELIPSMGVRPTDAEDRTEVVATVQALCASLHSAAAKGVEQVQRLFAKGCRYVLGFPEVSFWRRERDWQPVPLTISPPTEAASNAAAETLPLGEPVSPGIYTLSQPWAQYAVAAILPALRSDEKAAVLIGDFKGKTPISRERQRLLDDVLPHLLDAYTHAIAVEKDRVRLNFRNRHAEIVNSIFDALGSSVLDVGEALIRAARGLRLLGYRRVEICLVDRKKERIEGVLDDSDDPSVDVAALTDYPLSDPMADIQPYVVHTGTSKIVEDAAREPLVNQAVLKAARLKAFAVVPILDRNNVVAGTIHVERADGAVPSKAEAEDLEAFGRQLATLIEQSERVNLLQSTLDSIPEPVVIVDPLLGLRYANQPAADLLSVGPGWRGRDGQGVASGALSDDLRQALERGRLARHVRGLGRDPNYRGMLSCGRILDWRMRIAATYAHVEDLNYVFRVLEAFRLIAEAKDTPSAMRAVLGATKLLGHKWGRLYLVDENDSNRLVSKLSFGFERAADTEAFDTGRVELTRRTDPGLESWLSIEARKPIVFRYWREPGGNRRFMTPLGLEVVVIEDPHCRESLTKRFGDYWLDFPLVAGDQELGKVTLHCDEDLRPEDFELLSVLSEMAAGLLDAFLRRERMFKDREQWIRAGAEKSMGVMAHNINTQFAGFGPLLGRYKAAGHSCPQIVALNADFRHGYQTIAAITKRAKEMLKGFVIHPTHFDLPDHIRRVLCEAMEPGTWCVTADPERVGVESDADLLENALREMVQNSREVVPDATLRVTVFIHAFRRQNENWIRITYSDNGPGVPPELKQRILDDFFTWHPGKKPGTGLGLTLVRRVVEAHRGEIRETGEYKSGATFVIEVPASACPMDAKEI